jgi:hypothetical protein
MALDFFMGREFGVAEIFLSSTGDEKADLIGSGFAPVRNAMYRSGGAVMASPGRQLVRCPPQRTDTSPWMK